MDALSTVTTVQMDVDGRNDLSTCFWKAAIHGIRKMGKEERVVNLKI